jgi:RHS repeat-associated protein
LYNDAVVAGGTDSNTIIGYDLRGLPSSMRLIRNGVAPDGDVQIATITRNVAGLVTKRRANTTGAMTFIESNWSYDKLGRVASQVVEKGPGPTQVVRQDLTYFGNDDPKTLAHSLGTSTKQFQFGYDLRHQLTSANETTTAGYFTSSYFHGTAGRFTRATIAQPTPPAGSEVKPRDVTYQYGDPDPERVTALIDVGAGTPFASYAYDDAGNQTVRCYGSAPASPCAGESTEYLYDGQDQLRRATKKLAGAVQGSEEYWYGSDGQRIAIVKRDAAGAKTEMIWFIGDTQAHYDSTGAVTRVYSHLSLGTPIGRVERTSNTSAPVEFQFHGLASNTLAAVEYDGTVNASFSYTPFGEVVEAIDGAGGSGTAAHRRRLNDKYHDELTDLAYYGFRYYDKTLISWTQSDPLYRFEPERAWNEPRLGNLYSFSLNNALRYVDPDGRQPTGFDSPLVDVVRDIGFGDSCDGPCSAAAQEGQAAGAARGGLRAADIVTDVVPLARGPKFVLGLVKLVAEAIYGSESDSVDAFTTAAGGGQPPIIVIGKSRIGVPDAKPKPKGKRMTESATLKRSQDQLTGISNAQAKARGRKTADDGTPLRSGDATIGSKKKSEDNVDNRLDRIKSSKDIEPDDIE